VEWGPLTGWPAGIVGAASFIYAVFKNRGEHSKLIGWEVVEDTSLVARGGGHGKSRALLADRLEAREVAIAKQAMNQGDVISFRLLVDNSDKPVDADFHAGGFRFVSLATSDPGARVTRWVIAALTVIGIFAFTALATAIAVKRR
jgi:hypothetical protein